jgi:sulfite reductase alpha subunit-like flavoprotein
MDKERGHLYICGGTSMGREVVALLGQLYEQHGSYSEAEAAAKVKQLTAEGRLVQELWS